MFEIFEKVLEKITSLGSKDIDTTQNHVKVNAEDILNGHFKDFIDEFSTQKLKKATQQKKLQLPKTPKQLSKKEVGQLIWHSFRLSEGHVSLQFSMLYSAYLHYGKQELPLEQGEEAFLKMLNIGEKHTENKEWPEPNWSPPHPKINRIATELHTDIGVSKAHSHIQVKSYSINEFSSNNPLISMLLQGEGSLHRSDIDGGYSISKENGYQLIGNIIETIFQRDFSYLLEKSKTNYQQGKYDVEYPGRPNRLPENDGKNNIKDRYFSYFVWYILRDNSTGNEFFDVYFSELRKGYKKWFSQLPKDSDLPRGVNSIRNKHSYSLEEEVVTQEDVLYLITQYNLTHPETQISIEELL